MKCHKCGNEVRMNMPHACPTNASITKKQNHNADVRLPMSRAEYDTLISNIRSDMTLGVTNMLIAIGNVKDAYIESLEKRIDRLIGMKIVR